MVRTGLLNVDSHGSLELRGDFGSLRCLFTDPANKYAHKNFRHFSRIRFCEVTKCFSRWPILLSTVYQQNGWNDYGNEQGKTTETSGLTE
jgi:hypothetical protein